MKAKRFMESERTERRIADGALWLFAACVLLILLTSCSGFDPYKGLQQTNQTTEEIITNVSLPIFIPKRDERWELHNLNVFQFTLTDRNNKRAGH